MLAARIKPGSILDLGVPGAVFLGILILVVRPAAAFASTIGGGLKLSERAFLAWIHPRGIVAAAVCSVFALELVHAAERPAEIRVDAERLSAEIAPSSEDLPAEDQGGGEGPATEIRAEAEKLVPVTFLVIVGTVTVYGLSVAPLARWLKVAEANPQGVLFAGANPLVRELAEVVQREGFPVLLVDLNQPNITAARMQGLPVCWANVCSEYAREELELAGIGRLLAMTPSDEVNSLAAREFIEAFGRAEIYQLAHRPAEVPSLERLLTPLPGRILFDKDATFDALAARLAAGAIVKATNLTAEFDYNAFLRHYGASAVVLMVISSSHRLRIVTAETTLSPQPGEKLISFVDPDDATSDSPPPPVEL
jgi:Trk K+ transport system NAD-binding subunit